MEHVLLVQSASTSASKAIYNVVKAESRAKMTSHGLHLTQNSLVFVSTTNVLFIVEEKIASAFKTINNLFKKCPPLIFNFNLTVLECLK